MAEKYDVMVVGAGNAGLSAAVSCAAQGKKTLLIEKQQPAQRRRLQLQARQI